MTNTAAEVKQIKDYFCEGAAHSYLHLHQNDPDLDEKLKEWRGFRSRVTLTMSHKVATQFLLEQLPLKDELVFNVLCGAPIYYETRLIGPFRFLLEPALDPAHVNIVLYYKKGRAEALLVKELYSR